MAGLVGDRYDLLEVLGKGGDSEVVRAIDRRHDRLVALKVRRLPPDEAREPLLAEGRTLLELRPHPALAVVRVLGWQRGEVDHLVEPAQQLLEQFPDLTAWPAAVALAEVLAGLHDEARERLRLYCADLDVLHFDAIWMPALLSLGRGVPHRRRTRVRANDLRAARSLCADVVRRQPEPVRDGPGEPGARRPRVADGRLLPRRAALRRRTRDKRAHRRSPARGANVSRLRPDDVGPRRRRRPRARASAAHAGAIHRRAIGQGGVLADVVGLAEQRADA